MSSAAALALIHNHPSGDTTPSKEDIDITHRLKEGSELLGIRPLDHVIIGDNYYSFADRGQIYPHGSRPEGENNAQNLAYLEGVF